MSFLRHFSWSRHRSDNATWIVPGQLLLSAYPTAADLERAHAQGVRVVINLHRRHHDPGQMGRLGLTEVHIPVRDFTPPTPPQIDQGVAAITRAIDAGQAVLVHCAGGKGRSGTLAACYLVSRGMSAADAIAEVRALRPGAIETTRQEKAIEVWSQLPGRST